MTNKDKCFLAYISGLIEGEGTLAICREKRWKNNQRYIGRKNYWYYRPSISIGMTDALNLAIIKDYFKESFKIGFWMVVRPKKCGRKPYYRLDIQRQSDVYEFLELIQPYLINKVEQSKILKSFVVFLRKWQYQGKNCYNQEFQKKCEYYYNLLIVKHSEQLNGVNSVKLLNQLDLKQYRAKLKDVEKLRKEVKSLFRGVETKLSQSTDNKTISSPEKEIVH